MFYTSQVVQDFFHQQDLSSIHQINPDISTPLFVLQGRHWATSPSVGKPSNRPWSRVIYPGLTWTWYPLMVSGTHTIPISLGILDWEWYGNSMGPKGSHVLGGSLKIPLTWDKKRCGNVAISFLLKKPRCLVLFVNIWMYRISCLKNPVVFVFHRYGLLDCTSTNPHHTTKHQPTQGAIHVLKSVMLCACWKLVVRFLDLVVKNIWAHVYQQILREASKSWQLRCFEWLTKGYVD